MSATASHLDPFIANWSRVHKQSARLMKSAPNDKYDWKPCDSAMPLGELMNHLYIAEALFIDSAMTGVPLFDPASLRSVEAALSTPAQ